MALGHLVLESHTRVMITSAPEVVSQVVLVDPDPLVLTGLTSVLNQAANVQVIAAATDRSSALALVDGDTDAVIVIARRFHSDDGHEICQAMRVLAPRSRCIIHSAGSIDEHDVLRSGGTAAVLKQLDNDDLIRTIRDLARQPQPD